MCVGSYAGGLEVHMLQVLHKLWPSSVLLITMFQASADCWLSGMSMAVAAARAFFCSNHHRNKQGTTGC